MMNLYGNSGLGAAGTGIQSGGSVGSAGGMSPQLMAMLSALQGGGQSQGMGQMATPNTASPLSGGAAGTPMAQYIGAPQGGGMNVQAPMMPQGQQQPLNQQQTMMGAMSQAPQQAIGTLQGAQNMQDLLAKLKGGQTGVQPGGGAQNAPSLTSMMPQAGPNGTTVVPSVPEQSAQGGNSWLTSLLSRMGMGGGTGS